MSFTDALTTCPTCGKQMGKVPDGTPGAWYILNIENKGTTKTSTTLRVITSCRAIACPKCDIHDKE